MIGRKHFVWTAGFVKGPSTRIKDRSPCPVDRWTEGTGLRCCHVATAESRSPGVLLALVLGAFMLLAGGVHAQTATTTTAVCSDNPGSNERVECVKGTGSAADIVIDLPGGTMISTTEDDENGVFAQNDGTGDIVILADTVTITTGGNDAHGIIGTVQVLDNLANPEEVRNDITIDVSGVDITTSGESAYGVAAFHSRSLVADPNSFIHSRGNIVVRVRDGDIVTSGKGAEGINVQHQFEGNVDIVAENLSIRTTGENAVGIFGYLDDHPGHTPKGNVKIVARNVIIMASSTGIFGGALQRADGGVVIEVRNSEIVTGGNERHGIFANKTGGTDNIVIKVQDSMIANQGNAPDPENPSSGVGALSEGGTGDIIIEVRNSEIVTVGKKSHGILANKIDGTGNIAIKFQDSMIATQGNDNSGVGALSRGGTGDIIIEVRNSEIVTVGNESHGILANKTDGTGNIVIKFQDSMIATQGNDFSTGVHAVSRGVTGDIIIDLLGGTVETEAAYSYGVYAWHTKWDKEDEEETIRAVGDIRIATDAGNSIVTTGANGHGIVAYHGGEYADGGIDITVGGSIDVRGSNAQGIRVGIPTLDIYASLDEYGFRRQTVTVNGSIRSMGEGVFLTDGGRVVIGPWGTIHSGSGIAILAIGNESEPRLSVDFNLDGRRVAAIRDMIGDGWIINDGGRTAIAVNGHVLHDADDGPTDLVVPNGAWDVRWDRENVPFGERVTDRTDPVPAMWTIEEDYEDLKDRDFSADFLIGALVETHAPRAAVYEVLPGFLHSLDASGIPWRMESERPPVWLRFSGGEGTYRAKHASVGARYDSEHQSVEAGMDFPLGDSMLSGTVSVRSLRGEARVAALTGGGSIRASGVGMGLGLHHEGTDGFYASGGYSYTDYSLDMSSGTRGALVTNAGATGHTFHVETGKRLDLGKGAHVTPRAMATSRRIDIDGFTDTLGSRVSYDASRSTVAVGLLAETRGGGNDGGGLGLWGSLDLERAVGAAGSVISVSGTGLVSRGPETRLNLGVGGRGHRDGHEVDMGVFAKGVGSDDRQVSAWINLRKTF